MGLIVSSKDGSEAQLIRRQYSNAYPSPQHRFSASGEGGCCLSAKVSDSTCYIAQLETEHDEDGDEDMDSGRSKRKAPGSEGMKSSTFFEFFALWFCLVDVDKLQILRKRDSEC